MSQIFIVMGIEDHWDDSTKWCVAAFNFQWQAEKFCQELNDWIQLNEKQIRLEYEKNWRIARESYDEGNFDAFDNFNAKHLPKPPQDPEFQGLYFNIEYVVVPLKVMDIKEECTPTYCDYDFNDLFI